MAIKCMCVSCPIHVSETLPMDGVRLAETEMSLQESLDKYSHH